MGPTNSKNKKQSKIQHERFQIAKVINDEQIQIELRSTLDDYNNWKSNLKKINSFNKQNILFPLSYSFEQQGWCSQNTGIVKITYDNYQFVLQQELQNRITLQKHLSQQQMWYLLFTLVSTVKDFSYLNRKVGDIRPHNIFVSQAGQIKVAVCFSWPNECNNLQKTINQKQITYLSPQEIQIVKNKKMDSIINIISAQSFSIGLTMLHAGLLFNFSCLYNLQKLQINKKLLEQKVQQWMNLQFFDQNNNRTAYSSSLKQIIKNLCILDLQARQSSIQVYNILQPHKQSILNIEPFQLSYKSPHMSNIRYVPSRFDPFPLELQKSKGLPVYNYTQMSKNINSNQIPFGINQSSNWNTRVFTQIPVNSHHDYHHQLFDKYANSASPNIKGGQLNIKLTNTISQRENSQNKPAYVAQTSLNQPGLITVKPFSALNQQINTNIVTGTFKTPVYGSQLQSNISKKVQSTKFISYGQPLQDHKYSVAKIQSWSKGDNDSLQFLRKIDEQLQRSKSMFPS